MAHPQANHPTDLEHADRLAALRAEVARLTQERDAARRTHEEIVAVLKSQRDEARGRGERWRSLVVDLTRCQHGRIQGDRCFSCPDGTAPDVAGRHIGHSLDGRWEVIVPLREQMADPEAWYDGRRVDSYREGGETP